MTFLYSLMVIVQLVPKLLARKRRKSTPTQGQDANRYLCCLYKKESQLTISVSTKNKLRNIHDIRSRCITDLVLPETSPKVIVSSCLVITDLAREFRIPD